MKIVKLLIGIAVTLAAAHVVFGQTTEGVIDYDVKENLHRNLPPERQEMKNMVPEFRTIHMQLFFNADASLYRSVEEDDNDFESEHGGLQMKFQQPQIELFVNPSQNKEITMQEFMGKMYLMEDSLKVIPWKFGTALKRVMGYECKQATYFNEERKQQIVAWYTPDKLRPYLGPDTFNTLPGAVLEIDINEGERIITAKKLTSRTLKRSEMKPPSQGVKITKTEFRKMVQEQVERMRANGGNVIIRN